MAKLMQQRHDGHLDVTLMTPDSLLQALDNILGVITLAKWMFAPKTTIPNNDIPLEILKRRYAKGAISPEEYQKLKHDLNE